MTKLKRIYHDGSSWNFADYFDYLEEMADEMPPALKAFASAIESYSLNGNRSLHDARVLSLLVRKEYEEKFSGGKTVIEISLIDQLFEGRTTLRYGGVTSFCLNEPNLDGIGHADVLLHEFSIVHPGIYLHHIVLDHDGELCIEFKDFSHEWTNLNS